MMQKLENPRARYWQDRKVAVAVAAKVKTRRALETDPQSSLTLRTRGVGTRVLARARWQPPHPWMQENRT